MARGPGIAKVRTIPMLRRASRQLIAMEPGRVAEWLASADIVSEGQCREEPSGLFYYGSTNIALSVPPPGEVVDVGGDGASRTRMFTAAQWARIIAVDPHCRIRLLRIAHREASSRANGMMGPLSAELEVSSNTDQVVVSIDIVAPVATGDRQRASASSPSVERTGVSTSTMQRARQEKKTRRGRLPASSPPDSPRR